MAYRLKPEESLARGIRRIAEEEIDAALDELNCTGESDSEEVVHDIRKRFKRIRALLRLARGGLGRRRTDRENAHFRDAGRHVSALRDAAALVEAFDGLIERSGPTAQPEAVGVVRSALVDRKRSAARGGLHEETALEEVESAVKLGRNRIKHWEIEGGGWDLLRDGVRRIYRAGHRAFRSGDASDEALHEWRKRVKDLWHALEILQPIRPAFTETMADQAHALADALGDDHDLAVLHQLLRDPREWIGDPEAVAAVLPLIDGRRAELQRDAHARGEAVYRESPKIFVARLRAYWRAWRSELEASRFE